MHPPATPSSPHVKYQLSNMRPFSTRIRPKHRIVALAIILGCLLLWKIVGFNGEILRSHRMSFENGLGPSPLPCRTLPGADETLVILRTGSTEIEDRFTIHLTTSLRCFPHYLIFSDLEEEYHGEQILDALDSVNENIRNDHPDFELYRRLQRHGRNALDPSELSGSPKAFASMNGNTANEGWKLDKWKFLPMVNRTLHEYPDMKWYVFIEADSFLLWTMLLQYLALLDHTKPFYGGSQMLIAGELFAHGGSGFIVSQPAMRLAVQHYAAHKNEIEAFTDSHWAGDCVLGKYIRDAGVSFKNAWPHFQGDYPGLVPYARADGRSVPDENLREWCYPTVSYHHMSPDMVKDLWDFEQQWMRTNDVGSNTLRHKDIFRQLVMPQMMTGKLHWDNLSDKEEGSITNMEECRKKCEAQPGCKQYSLVEETRQCRTRGDPRLGKEAQGVRSDWLKGRILEFERRMAPCGDEGWLV